jgi:hypothetical protein
MNVCYDLLLTRATITRLAASHPFAIKEPSFDYLPNPFVTVSLGSI